LGVASVADSLEADALEDVSVLEAGAELDSEDEDEDDSADVDADSGASLLADAGVLLLASGVSPTGDGGANGSVDPPVVTGLDVVGLLVAEVTGGVVTAGDVTGAGVLDDGATRGATGATLVSAVVGATGSGA
jgi:hypothetical protein